MQTSDRGNAPHHPDGERKLDSKEIVMGLNWDPPSGSAATDRSDLDALCVLFNRQHRVLDVIHPGATRDANGSVIHTGDSQTGAGEWDDERIFVFLEALPEVVAALTFVVVSATGRAFSEVHDASCHISDRVSEDELFRLKLTDLAGCTACKVATLRRTSTGWQITTDAQPAGAAFLAELAVPAASGKGAGISRSP